MGNEIEEQNKQAATSYVTAAEFEDFKDSVKNFKTGVLGLLHQIVEDITRLELKPTGDKLTPTEKG